MTPQPPATPPPHSKHNSSRSIYKTDTCYREGNGFSPAKIATSIKFEANGKMTKYGSGDCTGAGVATNDGSGACGGKFKVARAAIPVGLLHVESS